MESAHEPAGGGCHAAPQTPHAEGEHESSSDEEDFGPSSLMSAFGKVRPGQEPPGTRATERQSRALTPSFAATGGARAIHPEASLLAILRTEMY